MLMTSIGDMASSLMLRTRSMQLKQTMAQLTDELSSGRISDLNARVGGDYSYLSDIENGLKRLEGYSIASTEAGILASSMQSALERTQGIAEELSATLIFTETSASGPAWLHGAEQAEAQLTTLVSTLNLSVAGRSLFAGTATDTPALASAEDLLAGLRTAVAGQSSSTDIRAAAQAWFDDPAGFAATIYTGADQDLTGFRIAETEQVSLSIRADDEVFRGLLQEVALAALVKDDSLGLSRETRTALLQSSGEALLSVSDDLTGMRADLGFAESRIAASSARTAAARTSLEYARGELLAADPFETATRLEDVQFRLESLYAMTVRSASLSLVSYLR